MSEQTPWGAPPPSPPPPGGPYGGGFGQGPYPPSPYGQGPPPKKHTGLVVAIVAAVLLVLAAFAVTLVVVGRGGDDPAPASSSATSDPVPTTAATSEATTGASASAQPTGEAVTGQGYTYELPAVGWKEASADAKKLAATIDSAIILGASIDHSQSSIIVEALSSGGATSVDDLAALWKRNLSSSDHATPVDIDETTIDGERAIGVRIDDRVNNAGVPINQVAYLTIHDGMQYSIGLSFPKKGDAVSQDDFATMLDSWTWTS